MGDNRRYPERPILGVGAIVEKEGRVLLVERGQEPLKGTWTVPGGVVEVGERLEHAIRREVFEETGLEIEPVEAAEVYQRILPDPDGRVEYHYVLIDYLCRVAGGELRAASDASRAEWVAPCDLRTYHVAEGTIEVIERALARLAGEEWRGGLAS